MKKDWSLPSAAISGCLNRNRKRREFWTGCFNCLSCLGYCDRTLHSNKRVSYCRKTGTGFGNRRALGACCIYRCLHRGSLFFHAGDASCHCRRRDFWSLLRLSLRLGGGHAWRGPGVFHRALPGIRDVWSSGQRGGLLSWKVFFSLGLFVFSFFIPKIIERLKAWRQIGVV